MLLVSEPAETDTWGPENLSVRDDAHLLGRVCRINSRIRIVVRIGRRLVEKHRDICANTVGEGEVTAWLPFVLEVKSELQSVGGCEPVRSGNSLYCRVCVVVTVLGSCDIVRSLQEVVIHFTEIELTCRIGAVSICKGIKLIVSSCGNGVIAKGNGQVIRESVGIGQYLVDI